MSQETKKNKRTLVGKVVSDKMQQTIVVEVTRAFKEARVKKIVRSSKKYKAHDAKQEARIGDIVEISEGRPMSKTKYMYLSQIIRPSATKG